MVKISEIAKMVVPLHWKRCEIEQGCFYAENGYAATVYVVQSIGSWGVVVAIGDESETFVDGEFKTEKEAMEAAQEEHTKTVLRMLGMQV